MFSQRTSWNLAPNALTLALQAHRRAGKSILDLTCSNPTQVGLQFDGDAILRALTDPVALTYLPEPRGLLSARDAVVEYYRDLEPAQSPVSPKQIILTVSTSEAYSFVFRLLCNPGDEVLIPTPSYPLFHFLADLQDVRLTPYSLYYDHGWHIDFHVLELALTARSRAIVLVHPNNPTGSFVSATEAERINLLCRQHGLALLVDEVFLDYALGVARPSFALNSGALTFTLSGLSKISALPQMKLAWVVCSGLEDLALSALARLEVIADTYLSMNAPIQLAAPILLSQRHSIRKQLMGRVSRNLAELDRQLPGSRCSRLEVEGGWYVTLRVPVTRTDEELAIALLKDTGVLVQPGYFYDFSSDGYLVLSLITPEDEFREGVHRVLEHI
jgi:aspartate/methionine/tyrosine aminotransferase